MTEMRAHTATATPDTFNAAPSLVGLLPVLDAPDADLVGEALDDD